MPLYEFFCDKCQKEVSLTMSIQERQQGNPACPECGTSVPQLEPRSFSFNSKFGACPKCAGLGSKSTFDAAKVIVDPSLPLLGGAIAADLRNPSLDYILDDFAKARAFPKADRPMEMKNLKVIALVQNDKTKEIVQAAHIDIEGKAVGGGER